MADEIQPVTSKKSSIYIDLILIAIVLVAAVLTRLHYAPANSNSFNGINGLALSTNQSPPPSVDELWHLALSTGWGDYYSTMPINRLIKDVPSMTSLDSAKPWYTVWGSMNYVVHPPLYVQTLRIWRNLFGGSDIAAVWYSVLWSYASVLLVYFIVRLECSALVACMAALVMAISRPEIYYAFEIRGYSMFSAVILLLMFVTLLIVKRDASKKLSIALSTMLFVSMMCHYLAFPCCLACGCVALFAASKKRKKNIIFAVLTSVFLFIASWGWFAYNQYRTVSREDLTFLENTTGLILLLKRIVILPYIINGDEGFENLSVMIFGPVLLMSVFAMGLIRKPSRPIVLVVYFAYSWLIIGDLIRGTLMTAFIRYQAAVQALIVPSLFITFGNRLSRYAPRFAITSFIILGALLLRPQVDFPVTYDSPSFAAIIQPRVHTIAPDETIVIASEDKKVDLRWVALELSHIPHLFPKDVIMIDHPMNQQLLKEVRTSKIWLIVPFAKAETPSYWIPGAEPLPQSMKAIQNTLYCEMRLHP